MTIKITKKLLFNYFCSCFLAIEVFCCLKQRFVIKKHLLVRLNYIDMRNLILIALLICTFYSCKKDDEKYPQKWQLTTMSGQLANVFVKGTALPWQEYYLLNADGTFIKSREQNGVLTEVSGKYSFEVLSNDKYLMLTYETTNSIIGNGTSDLKEVLVVQADNTLFSSTAACDGPSLTYEKVE